MEYSDPRLEKNADGGSRYKKEQNDGKRKDGEGSRWDSYKINLIKISKKSIFEKTAHTHTYTYFFI